MAEPFSIPSEGLLLSSLQELVRSNLIETHTSLPGTIVSFNPETQRATVRIGNSRNLNGEIKAIPPIKEIPVHFPQAGGYCLTLPVKEGDEGSIVFLERAMDTWIEEGGVQDPISNRIHDYNDAYFIPGGIRSLPNSINGFNNVQPELRDSSGNTKIVLDSSGKFSIQNSSEELITLLSEVLESLVDSKAEVTSGSSSGTWELTTKSDFEQLLTRLNKLKLGRV